MSDREEIPFAKRVYRVVEVIPNGSVTTYGAIASAIGSPRSARVVGYVLNMLKADHQLPAHRVLNRNGFLSGGWHFGHPDIMRARLELEGVAVSDEYIVDLGKFFWDPASDPTLDDLLIPNY